MTAMVPTCTVTQKPPRLMIQWSFVGANATGVTILEKLNIDYIGCLWSECHFIPNKVSGCKDQ